MIVDAVASFASAFGAEMVPRCGFNVFAAVFRPLAVEFVSQDARVFFADVANCHLGANVQADAVVEVGVPAKAIPLSDLRPMDAVPRKMRLAKVSEAKQTPSTEKSEPPLSLGAILALANRHTEEELTKKGLSEPVRAAQNQRDQLLREAAALPRQSHIQACSDLLYGCRNLAASTTAVHPHEHATQAVCD